MTETTDTLAGPAPEPPPGPAPRLLYRDPADTKIAGVCGSIGRYTDTDPVLWRVVLGVLAVFGGAGLVLYALGWLLIPKRAADGSLDDRWQRRPNGALTPLAIAALVVAGILVIGLDDGRNIAALAVLGVVGFLAYREHGSRPVVAGPASGAPVDLGKTTGSYRYDLGGGAAGVGAPPPPTAWGQPGHVPPATPRERSRLGLATLSAAALVAGALSLLSVYGVDSLTASRILATTALVVGVGLLIGTWIGRARWLAVVGVVLLLAAGGAAAGENLQADGVGERTWVPAATSGQSEFRLGAGEATLDLRGLPADGQVRRVTARIGAGELTVLVPSDRPVRIDSDAGVGEVVVDGDRQRGRGNDRVIDLGPAGDPVLVIDASVGVGEVEVRRG